MITLKKAPAKIEALEELARTHVGDGKRPNLFFVSLAGSIVTVTRDFATAYDQWKQLASPYGDNYGTESALEDRKTGTIATREPREENSDKLCTLDDTHGFGYHK